MLDDRRSNEQYVVVFTSNGTDSVYSATYSEEQDKNYLIKCLQKHGRNCNARVIPAKQASL